MPHEIAQSCSSTSEFRLNNYRLPIIDLLDEPGTQPSAFNTNRLLEFLVAAGKSFGYGSADVPALFDRQRLLRTGAGTLYSNRCEVAAVLPAQVSSYTRD